MVVVQEPEIASIRYVCQDGAGKPRKGKDSCQKRKANDLTVTPGVITSLHHQEVARIPECLELLPIVRTKVLQTCLIWMTTIHSLRKGSCLETKSPVFEKGLSKKRKNAALRETWPGTTLVAQEESTSGRGWESIAPVRVSKEVRDLHLF